MHEFVPEQLSLTEVPVITTGTDSCYRNTTMTPSGREFALLSLFSLHFQLCRFNPYDFQLFMLLWLQHSWADDPHTSSCHKVYWCRLLACGLTLHVDTTLFLNSLPFKVACDLVTDSPYNSLTRRNPHQSRQQTLPQCTQTLFPRNGL